MSNLSNTTIPYGYVYKTTNKVNGKSYIGMRKLRLDKSWRQYLGSGRLLKQAIDKNGKENFTKAIVCYADTLKELQNVEWEQIQHFKSIGEAEYNLFTGKGAGGDTFALLAGIDREEALKRQIEGLHRVMPEKAKRVQEKHEKFVRLNFDAITQSYRQTVNMRTTADNLTLPYKKVIKVIQDAGLVDELSDKRKKITKADQRSYYLNKFGKEPNTKPCKTCRNVFSGYLIYCSDNCKAIGLESYYKNKPDKSKFVSSYDELFQLWVVENKNIFELMEHFGCKQRAAYYLLEKNGLPTSKYKLWKMFEQYRPEKIVLNKSCEICGNNFSGESRGVTCSNSCRGKKSIADRKARLALIAS